MMHGPGLGNDRPRAGHGPAHDRAQSRSSMEDFVVVGSGCTGAMAAATLIEGGGGARVLMLDAGERDDRYAGVLPSGDFVSVRTTDREQYRYFLGEDFE